MRRLASALGLALAASAALAQAPSPVSPPAGPGQAEAMPERPGPRGGDVGARRFSGLSPEGRALIAEALRPAAGQEERARIRAARERVHALLAADRLDVAALRRAMEEERRLVEALHAARQARMLEAFQKMSVADRRAFAENARRGRLMAEARAERWRAWAEEARRRRMEAPVPPPAPGTD